MDDKKLTGLLENVKNGSLEISSALDMLKNLPYESLDGFAKLDQHRSLRCGFPEVVFGQGKDPAHLVQIINRLSEKNSKLLVTRLSVNVYEQIQSQVPQCQYHEAARLLTIGYDPKSETHDGVLVLTAGTVDIPVSEEAAITAELMGNRVTRLYDVGVAGLHRLLANLEVLRKARVIVAVAGMDGALPSVVGGLVSVPVIAVPTSFGYGASFQGIAALLTMLNSCASGVAVVNIDNGFGAGVLASRINLGGVEQC